MTVFDYLVLIIIGASLLLGMWRGVVGEIIALVAWILAFFAARWWGGEAARLFVAIDDPTLRLVTGWVSVAIAVLVGMAVLRLAIRGLIKALGMSLSDRILGVIFGVARGLVIVMILVAIGGMTALPKEKWWSEAYFAAPLETAVLASKPWLPSDVAKRIRFG
ncbi:MAG TPA: CvpA family protein [Candidatus Accumulibacter phosphatis]|nr:MAG: Pur regulon 18 kDa protein [Candidatus Accumulibacter sp. SK-11]HAY28787.1 CvpA family protein [Accumulibacter sp.]HRL74902.1 CvpA family protein [Candidatus Accumulibacter phosphatis]HCN69433.1 CvpA family protein [Accumulibacter sp.]HCV13695.1 CvpA family protein [Accumulibacter sp.]